VSKVAFGLGQGQLVLLLPALQGSLLQKLANSLVDLVTTIFLQVTTDDTAKQREIKDKGSEEQQGGDDPDEQGENHETEGEALCVVIGVVLQFVGEFLRLQDRVQREGVDNLPRRFCKNETFPSFKREEDKECNIVLSLLRVIDL